MYPSTATSAASNFPWLTGDTPHSQYSALLKYHPIYPESAEPNFSKASDRCTRIFQTNYCCLCLSYAVITQTNVDVCFFVQFLLFLADFKDDCLGVEVLDFGPV